MRLDVPDDVAARAALEPTECLVAMAVQLYSDKRIRYGDACRLADLSGDVFDRELANRLVRPRQNRSGRFPGFRTPTRAG